MDKIPMCSATNPQAEIYVPEACMVEEAPVAGFWTGFIIAFVITVAVLMAAGYFKRKLGGFMGTFSMF